MEIKIQPILSRNTIYPELVNLSDDVKEKYNNKFFNNQFYNSETCEQYGKIIPKIFSSPEIERYFFQLLCIYASQGEYENIRSWKLN